MMKEHNISAEELGFKDDCKFAVLGDNKDSFSQFTAGLADIFPNEPIDIINR